MKSRGPSKRRPVKQDNLPATSLEEQERLLAERRRKLAEEMNECMEIVTKAPAIKQQQERVRRQQLEQRRAKKNPVPGSHVLVDVRGYNFDAPPISRGPRLRRERSQGRLTFFMLLVTLVVVLTWAYFTLSGPAQ